MTIFPQPQKIALAESQLPKPEPAINVVDSPVSERFLSALTTLDFRESEQADILLFLKPESEPKNGYTLSISSKRIDLTAGTEENLYFGLVTLRQILDQSIDAVPSLEISDSPDLENRGYMLDISRCKVPTMESLFELIDLLAKLKYNQLQLYTEHTFAYREHSQVWENASPLTSAEIRELDSYCFDRYIELVPNQNSFGHMERWLRYDDYKHLAESPNGFEHPISGWKQFGSTLKPTSESIDFVDTLYDELLPNFRSVKLNIGGDEPWELGQGFSKALVAERGKQRVYVDHLLRLHERVESQKHHMQFWGDILLQEPKLAKELPKNLTALLWGYEADHPFPEQCAAMRDADIPFYVVPGTSTWNSIGGRLHNAFANIKMAATNAIEHKASGLLLTDWGDNGHHQSHLLSIPSIVYAAGVSWNFQKNKEQNIESAIAYLLPNFEYKAILQLSDSARCFQTYLHNATWLNKVLFTGPLKLQSLAEELKSDELHQSQEHLDAIHCTGELELARQLLLFAAKKGIDILEGKSVPVTNQIPSEILSSFRQHWLARNRVGGMDESVAHLTDANPKRICEAILTPLLQPSKPNKWLRYLCDNEIRDLER